MISGCILTIIISVIHAPVIARDESDTPIVIAIAEDRPRLRKSLKKKQYPL
ncbi:MAG: hypothetical protein ACKO24_16090 [Leptolyngbyaceae cyanobacterium]